MPSTSIGSLCTGYGGLDSAVAQYYGAEIAFVSDIDRTVNRWLADSYPDLPNLGDVKEVDWSAVPPIDILTAGYPCQPFSKAGHRRGTDDPRHIWPWIADAIRALRPRLCVFENVSHHLRLGFDTVLHDLAEMGMDVRWGLVRASDAGAPHQRARLFIVATDPGGRQLTGAAPEGDGLFQPAERGAQPALLPTPPVNDMGRGKTIEQWDAWTAAMKAKHRNGNGHGKSLSIEVRRDLGPYLEACQRWEKVIGRHWPDPVVDDRLSPRFVEWMMGLPDGWVTAVEGVKMSQQLKMLGNGVVPQQALLALRMLDVSV